jgi:hypothetical protein
MTSSEGCDRWPSDRFGSEHATPHRCTHLCHGKPRSDTRRALRALAGGFAHRGLVGGGAVGGGACCRSRGSWIAAGRGFADGSDYDGGDGCGDCRADADGGDADRADAACSACTCSAGCRGVHHISDVYRGCGRGSRGRRIVVDRGFLPGVQRDAVPSQIAYLASPFETNHVRI